MALSLLAKPMQVTLPLVWLLLDHWSLGRITSWQTFKSCLHEKLPHLTLAAVIALVALVAQQMGGATTALEPLPLVWRLANASQAVLIYLGQFVAPLELSALYPYAIHAGSSSSEVTRFLMLGALAALTIGGLTAWAWLDRRRRPWWLTGWCWFLIALAPVVGLVQIGMQAHADRYTYWPALGLLVALVGGLGQLTRGRPVLAVGTTLAALALLAGQATLARQQTLLWRDSQTLMSSILARSPDSVVARFNRALDAQQRGMESAARDDYERLLTLAPRHAKGLNNLGVLDLARDESLARARFRAAIEIDPEYFDAWMNLASVETGAARVDALRRAVELRPDDAQARLLLGQSLIELGNVEAGERHWRRGLELLPEDDPRRAALRADSHSAGERDTP